VSDPHAFASVALPVHRLDARWLAVKDDRADFGPGLEGMGLAEAARTVDRWVNANIEYLPEAVDVWSPPNDTLQAGHGDCEDFAILKRALLLGAGFSDEALFLCLVMVPGLGAHAVLLVRTDDGMRVLDSLNSFSLPDTDPAIADYEPMLAYQGERAWVYGRPV
jgi:predicted transglutaminase-like cysteine proteinase